MLQRWGAVGVEVGENGKENSPDVEPSQVSFQLLSSSFTCPSFYLSHGVSTDPCPGETGWAWGGGQWPGRSGIALDSFVIFCFHKDENSRLLLSLCLESGAPHLPGKEE